MHRFDRHLTPTTLGGLLLAATCVYLLAYLGHPALPGASTQYPLGWWGWFDQGMYLKSTVALAEGDLSAGRHWYPFGYLLLGAPFVRWTAAHPFLVPDLLCFLAIALASGVMFSRLVSRVEAVVVVGLTLLAAPYVLETLVVPWTTIPTHALMCGIFLLLAFDRATPARFVAAGATAGLVFACRPTDLLPLVALFVAAALPLWDVRSIARAVGASLLGAVPVIALVLAGNQVVYGVWWATPYTVNAAGTGITFDLVPYRALYFLVDSQSVHHAEQPPLLALYPWVALALPGFVVGVRRLGWQFLGIPATIAASLLLYCAFDDLDPANLFKYRLIHYLAWTLPFFGWMAWVSVTRAWRELSPRVFAVTLLAPALLLGVVGVDSVEVPWSGEVYAGKTRLDAAAADDDPATSVELVLEGVAPPLRVKVAEVPFHHLRVSAPPPAPFAAFVGPRRQRTPADYKAFTDGHTLEVLFHEPRTAAFTSVLPLGAVHGTWRVSEVSARRFVFTWRRGLFARLPMLVAQARVGARRQADGADRAGDSLTCPGASDGSPDVVVRLFVPPRLAADVAWLEVRADGGRLGTWGTCAHPTPGWRIDVVDADGAPASLADGGTVLLHMKDNGTFRDGQPHDVRGLDASGAEVFRTPVAESSWGI